VIYLYRAPDGATLERDFPIGKAAATIRSDGKRFTRVYTAPVLQVSPEIHFESHSLPLNWKYAPAVNKKTGKPRFTSRRQVDESIARARQAGEPIAYD
jgi:hypothetical protein